MNYLKSLKEESEIRKKYEESQERLKQLILNINHIASTNPEYLGNIEKSVEDCIEAITSSDDSVGNS